MKKLLHLLLITQCAVLVAPVVHAADNLTSFQNNNGGTINNNQYNQMMNPERATSTSGGAAANFGNCDALIQRCVTPKCGTGCTDQAVAAGIVNGCVADSAECKKYADAIIAATVAQSLNKANAQAAAAQQQAAAAQQAASQQQMEQMNQQMQAMQQQMANQQAASQQQMQQALAEQQAANQALLTQQQQQAAAAPTPAQAVTSPGAAEVSADMIAREQIAGQVLSSLDGVDAGLRELKTTVQNVIDYAGCDYNASSCTGPKRVAAFRTKAQAFFQPYDNVLDALDNSLNTAIVAGIDVSDIYMMLTNSCSQWGKYLCPPIDQTNTTGVVTKIQINPFVYCVSGQFEDPYGTTFPKNCQTFEDANHKNKVQDPRCTFVEMYNNNSRDEIQQNFITANSEDATNIRMACISDGILQSGIFARRNRRKSNDFDIDALEIIINQDEPRTMKTGTEAYPYCDASASKIRLEQSVKTRKYTNLLVQGNDNGSITATSCNLDTDDMCYANPMYAMCTTHIYNSGVSNNDDPVRLKDAQEIIALKSTVIAQQLKKQSDYLNSMVKQIKVQLGRAVMTVKAEAAGAPSSSSSYSGGAGALPSGQIDCRFKSPSETISCVRNNMPGLNNLANGNSASDFKKAAQMNIEAVIGVGGPDTLRTCYEKTSLPRDERVQCISSISGAITTIETAQRAAQPSYGYYPPR